MWLLATSSHYSDRTAAKGKRFQLWWIDQEVVANIYGAELFSKNQGGEGQRSCFRSLMVNSKKLQRDSEIRKIHDFHFFFILCDES